MQARNYTIDKKGFQEQPKLLAVLDRVKGTELGTEAKFLEKFSYTTVQPLVTIHNNIRRVLVSLY